MIWILLACTGDKIQTVQPSINLTEQLSETEVRAGVVTDVASLFGGVSAEGALGDFKLYNNRAQFIIQSDRDSSYYMSEGCGLLDADIIRTGQSGRDVIDEYSPMAGLGSILACDSIEVIDDGSSGIAHVQVKGHSTPFLLLEGSVEDWNFVQEFDTEFTVDYRLDPNSTLLEVQTTLDWNDSDNGYLQMANVILLGKEVLQNWNPGGGFDESTNNDWMGVIGKENELALALLSKDPFVGSSLQLLLEGATPAMSSFSDNLILETGDQVSLTQFIGVGSDLAEITDQWYQAMDVATQEVSGQVTSAGEPVAGARVHLYDAEGQAITVAFTAEDGSWSALVPEAVESSFVVTGRGNGVLFDLEADSGWYSLYADSSIKEAVLNSMSQGGTPVPFASGFGVAPENTQELIQPGTLQIGMTDNVPAVAMIGFAEGDPQASSPWASSRPSGVATVAFLRDGMMDIALEPAVYNVIVHWGPECEYVQETIEIQSGQTAQFTGTKDCVQLPNGIMSFDPHSHSSPSADGKVSMAQRIMTHAAHSIDLHISTEHEHIADFQPIIDALGIGDHIQTMIGIEVSSPMKGHMNAYPLIPIEGQINLGAPDWWSGPGPTQELVSRIQARFAENAVLQANHPIGSSGLFTAADYNLNTGVVDSPYYWSPDFVAMELINGGYGDYLPYYFDMVSRGKLVTPVGVSDSHTYSSGVGRDRTYAYASNPSEVLTAIHAQQVVPSKGAYIHATIDEGFAPGGTFVGVQELKVEVFAASWVATDSLILMKNGEQIAEQEYQGEAVFFDLAPEEDAHYSVIASSSQSMNPVYGGSPWAMTAALLIDLQGDGWQAPLPAIVE
jgi:hypothetical protein